MKLMIRSTATGKWLKVSEHIPGKEAELQQFLLKNPDLIPTEALGDDRKPVAVWIDEAGLPGSGKTDLIGVDEDGQVVIVETKLAANAEIKRKVVGQILEYAAYLWQKPYDDFDKIVVARRRRPLIELMQDAVEDGDEWSADEFRTAVTETLSNGTFALFIVVDEMNAELRRIIDFINSRRADDFHFYALELKYFKADPSEVVLPQLYGVSSATSQPRGKAETWTDERFRESVAKIQSQHLRETLLTLYEFLLQHADEVKWGRGKHDGRVAFRVRHQKADDGLITLFRLRSDGGLKMGFGRIVVELPKPDGLNTIQRLLKALGSPRIQRWYEEVYAVAGHSGAAKTGWPGSNLKVTEVFPDSAALNQFKQAILTFKESLPRN